MRLIQFIIDSTTTTQQLKKIILGRMKSPFIDFMFVVGDVVVNNLSVLTP